MPFVRVQFHEFLGQVSWASGQGCYLYLQWLCTSKLTNHTVSLLLSSPWPSLLTSVQVFSNHLIQLSRPPQGNSLLLSRALPLPAQTSSSYLGSVSLWMSRFRFSLFDTTSLLLWNFSAFQQLFLMPFPCFQCSLAEQSDLWLVLSLFASLLAFRNHFMFQVHLDYALSPWHFFPPKEASLLLQWNQLVFLGLLSWSEPSSTPEGRTWTMAYPGSPLELIQLLAPALACCVIIITDQQISENLNCSLQNKVAHCPLMRIMKCIKLWTLKLDRST